MTRFAFAAAPASPRALGAALVCTFALQGCAWTVFTAVDAAGSAIQAGYAIASNYSSPDFVTGEPADVRAVCIEVNPNVSALDLVPAMQIALERRGVGSGVYNPGASPAGCEAQLTYSATVSYGRRSFAQVPVQYVSAIDLTLIEHGRIAVAARYQTGGLDADRFASASVKVRGLIDKIIVDQRAPPPILRTSLAD